MGRVLLLDLSNGISGDMFVAALINMGVPRDIIECELPLLRLRGYKFVIKEEKVSEISGCSLKIEVTRKEMVHRSFADIKRLILDSQISDGAKRIAIDIFTRLAEAEATVHSKKVDEVIFHELGAVDSIVDIVAASICLNFLNCEEIIATTPVISTGKVKSRHGVLPLPAPATVELLKGYTVRFEERGYETITPTGAAIVSSVAKIVKDIPPLMIKSRGYGFGDIRPKGYFPALVVYDTEYVSEIRGLSDIQIDATIDDMNPQMYPYIIERLFGVGVNDVFITPVIMKKGRPGQNITVICEPAKMNDVLSILFLETTTIGLRYNTTNRVRLDTKFVEVKTEFGIVRMKVAKVGSDVVNVHPEYEDLVRVAKSSGVSIKEIYKSALIAYENRGKR
ncbi:MAG: nickel pincer cofactor biosynthesis protein LarC [Myxococcota bacterium]